MTNVALIVLDTVRKDYFDEHATRLREMADVEFEWCYAPSSWSIPSHASIFSGELPHRHGVHSYNPDYSDLEHTFFDDLPHRSVGVSANGAVSESFGIDSLFDEFHSFAGNDEYSPEALSFGDVSDIDGYKRYVEYLRRANDQGVFVESLINGFYIKLNEALSGCPLPKVGDFGANSVVETSLSTLGSEPFFLFCNFIDAHGPMENLWRLDSDVPYEWSSHELDLQSVRDRPRDELETYLENYRELYASSVRYLDEQVAFLIERLQAQTDERTVFIITADHGEELRLSGEQDLGHMDFTSGLLHVPCVVIGAEGGDCSGQTSLLDTGAIVQSVARGDGVPDIARSCVPAERLGMMFYDGDDNYWTRGVRTVYEDDGRYEWDTSGRTVRYDVSKSRDCDSVTCGIPDRAYAVLDDDLSESVDRAKRSDDTADVSEETSRQLEDLGYKI